MNHRSRPTLDSPLRLALGLAFALVLTAASAHALPAKIALIHFNPVLGDDDANLPPLNALVEEALEAGADIVVTPELATTGFSITREEVVADLGFTFPYPELDTIRDLADDHDAYVFVGIAEVTPEGGVYNTVVVFGPEGYLTKQQKRGLSGWHDRGIVPFEVIPTPYGDLGTMICSDVYLPDWLRILTLKGADIALLPANWWGRSGQEEIWQTRARENGVWFLTANRWGREVDERFGFPFVYEMNDAPSAAISPDGEIRLIHRAEDDAVPANKILYKTVDVPAFRIGNDLNPVYTVNFREPGAYQAIANLYYRPDLGNQPAPGLPPAGITRLAAMAYTPGLFPAANLATIEQTWATSGAEADVLVLPGIGLSAVPVNASNPAWASAWPWSELQDFVEDEGLQLLVTSVFELRGFGIRESVLALRPGQPPVLARQIHDSLLGSGSGNPPLLLDLPNARVGLVLGRDALFPEISTHLAKSGADIFLIPSRAGAPVTSSSQLAPHYFWTPAALLRAWKTQTNHVVHLAASDWTGNGVVIENSFGVIGTLETVGSGQVRVLPVDSSAVRTKFLNAYYPFDLSVLLSD